MKFRGSRSFVVAVMAFLSLIGQAAGHYEPGDTSPVSFIEGDGPAEAPLPPGAIARFPVESSEPKSTGPIVGCPVDGKSVTAANYTNTKAFVWTGKGIGKERVEGGFGAMTGVNPTYVKLSPDGRYMVRDNQKVNSSQVVDLAGKVVFELPETSPTAGKMRLFTRFSDDGKRLYLLPIPEGKAKQQVTIVPMPPPDKATKGKSLDLPEGAQTSTFTPSPNGQFGAVLTGNPGGPMSLVTFSLSTGVVQSTFPVGENTVMSPLFFGANGADVGARVKTKAGQPQFVTFNTLTKTKNQTTAAPGTAKFLRFLPGTRTAVFGEDDDKNSNLTFFDFNTGKTALKMPLPPGANMTSLAVCANGSRIVTGQADGQVIVWDTAELFGVTAANAALAKAKTVWDDLGETETKGEAPNQAAHRAAWTLRTNPNLLVGFKETIDKQAKGQSEWNAERTKELDGYRGVLDVKTGKRAGGTLQSNDPAVVQKAREDFEKLLNPKSAPPEFFRTHLAPWLTSIRQTNPGLVTPLTWTFFDQRMAAPYSPSGFTQRLQLIADVQEYHRSRGVLPPPAVPMTP